MILEKSKSNKDLNVSQKSPTNQYQELPEIACVDKPFEQDLMHQHDKQKPAMEAPVKPKGVPKSFNTFGGSTLDESIKGEKDQIDDLTQIPNMELLQKEIKQAKKQRKLAAQVS